MTLPDMGKKPKTEHEGEMRQCPPHWRRASWRKKMEKYVEIRPTVMEGFPDAHSVILKVTNQQFVIGRWASETKDEAEWLSDMLCVALAKIVADAHGQSVLTVGPSHPPPDQADD